MFWVSVFIVGVVNLCVVFIGICFFVCFLFVICGRSWCWCKVWKICLELKWIWIGCFCWCSFLDWLLVWYVSCVVVGFDVGGWYVCGGLIWVCLVGVCWFLLYVGCSSVVGCRFWGLFWVCWCWLVIGSWVICCWLVFRGNCGLVVVCSLVLLGWYCGNWGILVCFCRWCRYCLGVVVGVGFGWCRLVLLIVFWFVWDGGCWSLGRCLGYCVVMRFVVGCCSGVVFLGCWSWDCVWRIWMVYRFGSWVCLVVSWWCFLLRIFCSFLGCIWLVLVGICFVCCWGGLVVYCGGIGWLLVYSIVWCFLVLGVGVGCCFCGYWSVIWGCGFVWGFFWVVCWVG